MAISGKASRAPIGDIGKPTVVKLPERVAYSPHIGNIGRPVSLKTCGSCEADPELAKFEPPAEPFVDEPMPDTKEGVEALREVVEGKIAERLDIDNLADIYGTPQWLYDEIRSRGGIAIKKGDAFYTEYSENLPSNIRASLTNKNGLPFDEMADELGMSARQLLEQLGNMGRSKNVTKGDRATTRKEIIAELRNADPDFDRAYTELEQANIKPNAKPKKKFAPKVEAEKVKPSAEEVAEVKAEPAEEVIGKGNSGEVIRKGDYVYKNATINGRATEEGKAYELLKGVEGVAQGRQVGDKIKVPLYEHIISVDEIPKDKRERIGRQLIPDNIARINHAVSEMSKKNIMYSDPLQFGYKGNKMDLLDFSNASILPEEESAEVFEDNFIRLSQFYRAFGLEKHGDIVSNGLRLRGYLQDSFAEDMFP